MWQSLFVDMFDSLSQSTHDQTESIVLAIHLFNISNDFQCTGLLENDDVSFDILPQNWNANHQLYSFRYSYKSLNIYQKFLRINESKLNVYTIRNDRNDKIINFSVDPSNVNIESEETKLAELLIETVLEDYKENVLKELGLEEAKTPTSEKKLVKQKSLLHDKSVPFGEPIGHSPGRVEPNHYGHFPGANTPMIHPANHAIYYPMPPYMYYPPANHPVVNHRGKVKDEEKSDFKHSAPVYHYPHGFY